MNVTGEILLSLSLFGKDTSGSSKLCATSKLLPKLSISPPLTSIDDDEPMLSPTSSVEMSDSSTDASNLVDVPVSPTLAVCALSLMVPLICHSMTSLLCIGAFQFKQGHFGLGYVWKRTSFQPG